MTQNSQFDYLAGRRVLLTGHTGFKGGWFSNCLKYFGARVFGLSLPEKNRDRPSPYVDGVRSGLFEEEYFCDIVDPETFDIVLEQAKPDIIFHLAAQAIVSDSYLDPVRTWNVNTVGTLNLLQSLRSYESPCSVIVITSDKCYENAEWLYGYRETDRLGGIDPYSSSKAAAEIAVSSMVRSFGGQFKDKGIYISTARAGNVIGGGDWNVNRIVPDIVDAWLSRQVLNLRNPHATRPWQHVLEPLSGYMMIGSYHEKNGEDLMGMSFNFGPSDTLVRTVGDLTHEFSKWLEGLVVSNDDSLQFGHEAGLLKLNCDLAHGYLKWCPRLDFEETVRTTAQWYQMAVSDDPESLTLKQIKNYFSMRAGIYE